jgi:hypothetical protein
MIKTNAARLLDRLAINYELRDYDVNPDDLWQQRSAYHQSRSSRLSPSRGTGMESVWQ